MSKKKLQTESFTPETEELRDRIYQKIGYNDKDNRSKSQCYNDFWKLILNTNSSPLSGNKGDIEHLNIDDKDGAIQTYLRKREAEIDRIEEAYRKEQARQKAKTEGEEARQKVKTEGETARAEIHKETENQKRFAKRYIQKGKPKVDWGDSAGVNPDYSEGRV